ncbi:hypothetical protein OK016_16505 [Vibrio chagasii]|nr:hypothetical protein [Vibrio chagasii]
MDSIVNDNITPGSPGVIVNMLLGASEYVDPTGKHSKVWLKRRVIAGIDISNSQCTRMPLIH